MIGSRGLRLRFEGRGSFGGREGGRDGWIDG